MSAVPAALPAAVRLPRSAAVRRALLTVLFLGGFLALALLFGGNAQAATDGVPGPSGAGVKATQDVGPAQEDRKAQEALDVRPAEDLKPSDASTASPDRAAQPHAEAAQETGADGERALQQAGSDLARHTERITGHVLSQAADGTDAVTAVTDQAGLSRLTDGLDGLRDDLPYDLGRPGRSGHSADDAQGPCGAQEREALRTDQGMDRAARASAHGSDAQATDGGSAFTALPDSAPGGDGPAADEGRSGLADDRGPSRSPLPRMPSVPASVGPAQGAAGTDQLAAYVGDSERCALPQRGAPRPADGTPTRDRSAEILEFPG